MPIINVIKNQAVSNAICYKVPEEDFNIGSQLIVAEYEEALFMKDGIVEQCFGSGKYTLTTENFPFLTKLVSKIVSGGISKYSCKVFFINKQHHLEQKWGTIEPVKILDPYWQTYFKIQARGAYTTVVKNAKQFFVKLIGADLYASENDVKRNFRTAFVQNISEELAEYISSSEEEAIVVCNKKKALADALKDNLNTILDEYGMELMNFYIENISVLEDENYRSIVKMRRERQEKMFNREQKLEEARLNFSLSKEKSEAERYISGQTAQADYERMKIRNRDDPNGWAKQEMSGILQTAAQNEGVGNAFISAGMGFGAGKAVGDMMRNMGNVSGFGETSSVVQPDILQSNFVICPKCNTSVQKGMKFCGACGAPMELPKRKCSDCGTEIPDGMKFCGNCGKPVEPQKRICGKCGSEVQSGMKFCGLCGNRME